MEKEKFEPPLAAALEPEPPWGVGGYGGSCCGFVVSACLASAPVPGGLGVCSGVLSHPASWALGMPAMLPGFLVFVFLTYNL